MKNKALHCLEIEKMSLEQQVKLTRNSQKGRRNKVISQGLLKKGGI